MLPHFGRKRGGCAVRRRSPFAFLPLIFLAALLACSGTPDEPDGQAYKLYRNPEGLLNGQARLPARCQAWDRVIELASFVQPVEGPGACGIDRPLQVYVLGRERAVSLNQPATLDCRFALLLGAFVEGPMQDLAEEHLDSQVAALGVGGSYACRTRNSLPGARISQHAKGLAYDLHSLRLADGRVLSIKEGWDGDSDERRFWQDLHAAACGPFNTVLGPEANRQHADHLHFDVVEDRSGRPPYCR
ncbi:MAG: hypothetical protein Kilf2KO_48920 [Rhodospirillales bacterium]